MIYEIVLATHITAFVTNISLVILADFIGVLWMLKKIEKLPQKLMIFIHKFLWLGLTISIVTGVYMFVELRDYLLGIAPFYVKMLFVLALIINSFFISKHLRVALATKSFNSLSAVEKRSFFISGAVSTFSWIAVVISAFSFGL